MDRYADRHARLKTLPSPNFTVKISSTLHLAGRAGGRATLLVGAAIEAGCVAYDIRKAKKAKRDGRLTDRDYEDVVGKRVAVAVGYVSLSTMGK